MKYRTFLLGVALLAAGSFVVRNFFNPGETLGVATNQKTWQFQAVDTMKYSRDLTAEKIDDVSFDKVIDKQIENIAKTGATHVAIATPYDERFVPMLRRWVKIARKHGLKVWFRGNFSGWEKWFGFDKIDREEHKKLTRQFILANPDIFQDGDVFSACPECENGGPGDPRQTGDVSGHRKFLIEEYEITKEAFDQIGKHVESNYASMNLDVAKVIMDRDTTSKMGNLVVIDHYIKDPDKLASDANQIAEMSGGNVVLGEFGAPIPDIHGELDEKQQAEWINKALEKVSQSENITGLSYWTGYGGSTKIWNDDDSERMAAQTLTQYYKPPLVKIILVNDYDRPVKNAVVSTAKNSYLSDQTGMIAVPVVGNSQVTIQKIGFEPKTLSLRDLNNQQKIKLSRINPNIITTIFDYLGI